jgi:hypothetical protein
MRTELEYEDMKLEEITEDEWWDYDYDEDLEELGIWSESAVLEIEGEE